MTVLEIIQRSADFLAKKGVESPRLQAELLLAHALGVPRLRLYLEFDRTLTPSEVDVVREVVRRRGAREPLQHIVGSASFCGFEIAVSPDVLIPRPETELLAERAFKFLDELRAAAPGPFRALDFGAGSGCLAVALAARCPWVTVCALDVSEAALKIARENALRHSVLDRIEFRHGDGIAALKADERFHLIVSNPPYIPSGEIEGLAPEVRDHDPRTALDGGPDGLKYFRMLAAEAKPLLLPRGKMMIEFGDGQETALEILLVSEGWTVEAVDKDYTSRPRIMIAARRES